MWSQVYVNINEYWQQFLYHLLSSCGCDIKGENYYYLLVKSVNAVLLLFVYTWHTKV